MERRSAAPLVFLHQAPRWILLFVLVGLLVAGLMASGWAGALALAALAALLAWFAYLSWPALSPSGRLLRVTGLVLLAAFLTGQVFGRL